MHALTAHVGTSGLPQIERFGIVAKLDADLFENDVGVAFDELQPSSSRTSYSRILRWI
jgi:hypothetical protein